MKMKVYTTVHTASAIFTSVGETVSKSEHMLSDRQANMNDPTKTINGPPNKPTKYAVSIIGLNYLHL